MRHWARLRPRSVAKRTGVTDAGPARIAAAGPASVLIAWEGGVYRAGVGVTGGGCFRSGSGEAGTGEPEAGPRSAGTGPYGP